MQINMPAGAFNIIQSLQSIGFEAYIVGGCVRDSLLGKKPHDWDICTSATPDQVKSAFTAYPVIETGIKHGTVTVLIGGTPYEVTTFRIDGEYSDHRRPDKVEFTTSLQEDLARRDFTINAMAYSINTGLRDPFCGQIDLMNGVIRCVGSADRRFQEDPLRIMRALRFAAKYGFKIEYHTLASAYANRHLLKHISQERLRDELCKLLLGIDAASVLMKHYNIIEEVIPEIEPCIGFEQNNPYHIYDVYKHTCKAIESYRGDDIIIKLALLFHDIGKPFCYTEDERGGHFKGHGEKGKQIAAEIMERLRFDNKTKNSVVQLVEYHECDLAPTPRAARRMLNKLGEEQLKRLIDLKYADMAAHAPGTQRQTSEKLYEFQKVLGQVIADRDCFSLKDLKINGETIMDLGLTQGKEVGIILRWLLEQVMDGEVKNTYHDLKQAAEKKIYGIG